MTSAECPAPWPTCDAAAACTALAPARPAPAAGGGTLPGAANTGVTAARDAADPTDSAVDSAESGTTATPAAFNHVRNAADGTCRTSAAAFADIPRRIIVSARSKIRARSRSASAGVPNRPACSFSPSFRSSAADNTHANEQYIPNRRCRPPPPGERSNKYQPVGTLIPAAVNLHERQKYDRSTPPAGDGPHGPRPDPDPAHRSGTRRADDCRDGCRSDEPDPDALERSYPTATPPIRNIHRPNFAHGNRTRHNTAGTRPRPSAPRATSPAGPKPVPLLAGPRQSRDRQQRTAQTDRRATPTWGQLYHHSAPTRRGSLQDHLVR